MAIRLPSTLETFFRFLWQVILGGLGFAFVYGVAVLIAAGVRWMEGFVDIPAWLHNGGGYVEKVLWGADICGFALFIAAETITFARRLWVKVKAEFNG